MMQKESRTDRWLRTGFVLFIIVLLMLIIFNGTAKTSDVSNWIIAFANLAMAAAAVVAWRGARRFLGEFFAQEGYRLAIEFVNDNVIHLGMDNKFTICTREALAAYSDIHGTPYDELKNRKYQFAVCQLETLLESHTKWFSNLTSLSFRMETYGIYAAQGKKEAMVNMVTALDSIVREGNAVLNILKADFRLYDSRVKSGSNLYMQFNCKHLPETRQRLNRINAEWNRMVAGRNEFLTGGKHAKELFVVREG